MSDYSDCIEKLVSKINGLVEQGDLVGLIQAGEYAKGKKLAHLAWDAIEKMNDPKMTDILISKGLGSNCGVKYAAVKALIKIGNEAATEALIFEMLKGESRPIIAEFLGKTKNDKAVKALISLSKDISGGDDECHWGKSVIEALGETGSEEALAALVQIIRTHRGDMLWQEEAAKSLVTMGVAAIVPLTKLLEESDYRTCLVGEALVRLAKDNKMIQPLAAILHFGYPSSSFDCAQHLALDALAEIGGSESVELLIGFSSSPQIDLCCRAINALGQVAANCWGGKKDKAIKVLTTIVLDDTETHMRGDAARVLGEIGASAAVEPLIKVLEETTVHGFVRGNAARSLGRIGNSAAINPLIRVLENPTENAGIKGDAAWALSQFNDDMTEYPLLKYIKEYVARLERTQPEDRTSDYDLLQIVGRLVSRLLSKNK